MIYLLGDFHYIQTMRLTGDYMKLSLATHMASNLVDIHDKVLAVPFSYDRKNIHRIITVDWKGAQKTCSGGIDINYITQLVLDQQEQLKTTFLPTLKEDLRKMKLRNNQAQLKEFRYWQSPVVINI